MYFPVGLNSIVAKSAEPAAQKHNKTLKDKTKKQTHKNTKLINEVNCVSSLFLQAMPSQWADCH